MLKFNHSLYILFYLRLKFEYLNLVICVQTKIEKLFANLLKFYGFYMFIHWHLNFLDQWFCTTNCNIWTKNWNAKKLQLSDSSKRCQKPTRKVNKITSNYENGSNRKTNQVINIINVQFRHTFGFRNWIKLNRIELIVKLKSSEPWDLRK